MRARSLTLGALLGLAALAGCAEDERTTKEPGAGVRRASLEPSAVGRPRTVAEGRTHDADVAVDRRTGRIYVAWAADRRETSEVTDVARQDLWLASSDDDGTTWSEPVRINDEAGAVYAGFNAQPRVAATGRNSLVVLWPRAREDAKLDDTVYNVMVARSDDGGRTFSRDEPIFAREGKTSELYGAVAARGSDVYAAMLDWRQDVKEEVPALSYGVTVARSKDGGERFGTSVRAALRSCDCCDNGIAIDSRGAVFVAFRGQDTAGEHTTIRDSMVTRSFDGGETWSAPVPMGDEQWVFNGCPEAGPELSADSQDRLHGVYWTGKAGRQGVYYTRSTDRARSFERPVPLGTADFYPPAYVDIAPDDAGGAWVAWDDRRAKERKVHLAHVSRGKVTAVGKAFASGQTPAVDAHDGRLVMVWSDATGLRTVSHRPAKAAGA